MPVHNLPSCHNGYDTNADDRYVYMVRGPAGSVTGKDWRGSMAGNGKARLVRVLREGTISFFGVPALLGLPAFSVLFMATAFRSDAFSGEVGWAWSLAVLALPACLLLVWLSGAIAVVTMGQGFWAFPLLGMLIIVGCCFAVLCGMTGFPADHPIAPMSEGYVVFLFGMLGLNLGVELTMVRFMMHHWSEAFRS